ncbi:hypothetical protein EUGRSUZ_F02222 [Eucalyptus grandis]|uniref:Uncharacterized protein n=2 Tax=Eucalyptus grandis TaxID=71139 RepID=A0ACC3KHB3_EUCGR|nr:hypothetical protein EUGRSUZ_F02222 [Eucalyptus grandis]
MSRLITPCFAESIRESEQQTKEEGRRSKSNWIIITTIIRYMIIFPPILYDGILTYFQLRHATSRKNDDISIFVINGYLKKNTHL